MSNKKTTRGYVSNKNLFKKEGVTFRIDKDNGEFNFAQVSYTRVELETLIMFSEKLNEWIDHMTSNEKIMNFYKESLEKSIQDFESRLLKSGKIKDTKTNVYLMQNLGNKNLKIGVSVKPKRRVSEISGANSNDVVLKYIIKGVPDKLERELHTEFRKYRISGEWFEYNEDIVDRFKELGTEHTG